jgi:hypothetical protein
MIKSFVAAVAVTIGVTGYAVAREGHHRHQRHHVQPAPSPDSQPGPPPDQSDIYWSSAGGNPVHYAQTRGFYAGR